MNDDSSGAANRLHAERLAALIDDRVTEEERAMMLERLANSADDLEIAADATAAVSYLQSQSSSQSLPESTSANSRVIAGSRKRWRTAGIVGLSLAAAAATLITVRLPRDDGRNVRATSGEMIGALSDKPAPLTNWNYYPWARTRGAAHAGDTTILIRVGVRAADLAYAVAAQDTMASQLANDIAMLLQDIPGGSAISALYTEAARGMDAQLFAQPASGLEELPQQDVIAVGSALEAARIAAERKDRAWFERDPGRRAVTWLSRNPLISPADRVSLEEILRRPDDWKKTQATLDRVLGSY
jgi:hypothetical protein